jgi:mannose-6-phosphate isomerase
VRRPSCRFSPPLTITASPRYPLKPTPTRIEPIFNPRIWGARSLAPIYPEKSDLPEPLGEAWLTGVDCSLTTGPYAGKTLGRAWAEMPAEWRGEQLAAVADFPLLVKFIFPTDKLSIQVHPDDSYASEHEKAAGGRGKTEMWYVVSARSGAQVLVGLKPGVDKNKFRDGLAQHTLEDLFESVPVHSGDALFVPAGTPHTIGSGMVICEVQEYSDLTYRVYDYGRVDAHGNPRELHIEKALEVTNFGRRFGGKVTALSLPADGATRSLLIACRFFATERWDCTEKCKISVDVARFELIIILEGAGTFSWPESAARYHRGECWLLPASQGHIDVHPETATSLIRTWVPNIASLRTELHRRGVSAAALAQVIFD